MRSSGRQDPVLDMPRAAEDVARYLAGDVDVEPGDLAGDGSREAEQVAADIQPDDQPAAAADAATAASASALFGKGPGWRWGLQS